LLTCCGCSVGVEDYFEAVHVVEAVSEVGGVFVHIAAALRGNSTKNMATRREGIGFEISSTHILG
jgi:hypothetical protein